MTEKKKPQFKRIGSALHSKLGKRRKKKQVWRRPTGRHNKMRNQMKGHPATVSIGYRTDKVSRNTLEQKQPVYVYNIKDLLKLKENQSPILAKVGKKKKVEIAKKARELNINIHNLNINKIIKKSSKKENKK